MKHFDDRALSGHRLMDALPAGVALIDGNDIIRHANVYLGAMTGYDVADLIGSSIESFVPSRHRDAYVEARRGRDATPTSGPVDAIHDLTLLRHDGSEIAIGLAVAPLAVDGDEWSLVAISDESIQRAALHAMLAFNETLADSELRNGLAFEENLTPMVYTDLDDRAIDVNEAFCRMIGRTRQEVLGRDSVAFTYPDDVGITEQCHRRLTTGDVDSVRYVKRYVHRDGRVIVIEASKSPARNGTDEALYFLTTQRDITDHLRRDKALGLLAEVNKLAIVAVDEDQFRQQLCDLLAGKGGFPLVWIGATSNNDQDGVDIMCAAGTTGYLYGDMAPWWGSNESGLGQAGRAIRTGATQVVSDLTKNAVTDPWRERASYFGFGSSVSIPDQLGPRRAVLSIYARDAFEFDEITVRGLEEVVRGAEFAITHVRSIRRTEALLKEATIAVQTLKATERALSDSETRFRLAFEDNMAPMIFSDLDDLAIGVNDAFCEMVGFTREELLGKDSAQFTHPEDFGITEDTHRRLVSGELDQARYVKRYMRKDGRVIISEVSRSTARDANGKTLYFVSSERDVTEERALTSQLSHQALHDPLTGLANRVLFEDRLAQAHARVLRQGGLGAVFLLDLDDFKGVNDAHGHFVGDQLLVAIARRLEQVARSSDSMCRFGGDEFLFLAEGLTSRAEVEDVARRLLRALVEPFDITGERIEQRASIGVAMWDDTSTCNSEFIQNADAAMYQAKREGKGHHVFFTPSMHQEAVNRFSLTQELRHALAEGELSMHYQPIVDLATSVVVGFESLMRWNHPGRGSVPPSVFIPLAEQSDLILELGAFALHQAVATAASWQSLAGKEESPYVTVNLSAHQFHDPGLLSMIRDALGASGLAPHKLVIEVTETVTLLDVAETSSVIQNLNSQGIGIALDDFGTGYSSLSYLTQLRPRILKIDQSFVRPVKRSVRNDAVLEAIVTLGQKLGMTVLAEGIETEAQLRRLRFIGCNLGQGYMFSAAVPADEATRMIGKAL